MRFFELSELEMIGNQIFLESMVLDSDSFGLGFEELVRLEAVFGAEFSIKLKVFEFVEFEFVAVSFLFLFFQAVMKVLQFGLVLDQLMVEDALRIAALLKFHLVGFSRSNGLDMQLVKFFLEERVGTLQIAVFRKELV